MDNGGIFLEPRFNPWIRRELRHHNQLVIVSKNKSSVLSSTLESLYINLWHKLDS